MDTYIHTYIHGYIHTYIHTYMDTWIHTYMHTYIHALKRKGGRMGGHQSFIDILSLPDLRGPLNRLVAPPSRPVVAETSFKTELSIVVLCSPESEELERI